MSTLRKDQPRSLPEGESLPPNPGAVSVRGSVVDIRFAQHAPPICPVLLASLVHQQTVSEAEESWRNEGNPN